MKQACYYYYYTFLIHETGMLFNILCMYAMSVNEITELSVQSIDISIDISFHTPVLVL